jgi:hypothetical protein
MKILFQVILVLALATRQAEQGILQNIKEKWLKEEDIMRVGRRLSRLTEEETQMTVAQNMETVYGLISNIRVLMEGGKGFIGGIQPALITMHQIVRGVNKLQRSLLLFVLVQDAPTSSQVTSC